MASTAKTCPICGKPTYSPRAKYCSVKSACRTSAWRERKRLQMSRDNGDSSAGMSELAAKVDLILHKLDSINMPPAPRGGAAVPSGGMSGTLASRDTSADADLANSLEVTTVISNVNAGQNLIDAMLRIGATVKNPSANGNGRGKGPRAMDVPSELPPPSFDDMDDISLDVAEATVR